MTCRINARWPSGAALIVAALLVGLVLAGCAGQPPAPAPTSPPQATYTPYPTYTPLPTYTPAPTVTAAQPTVAATNTPAPFYLVDNLGNKYLHSRMGGAADSDWPIQSPDYLMGYDDQNGRPNEPISWWEFAPARPGASSLTFVDDEHRVRVGPIVLSR